jgi:hypothetical protein
MSTAVLSDELEALRVIYADAAVTECNGPRDTREIGFCFSEPRSFTAVISVPAAYPMETLCCTVTQASDLSRAQVAIVNASLPALLAESAGSEHIMSALEFCSDAVANTRAAAAGAALSAAASSLPATDEEQAPPLMSRAWVWFHHIMSAAKKRCIEVWAAELGLGGVCKPGFPGVLVVEGAAPAVAEYLARLKALRWQAMAVREEETWPAEGSSGGGSSSSSSSSSAKGLVMLGEGDMDAVAAAAAEWGRLALFRSAILRLK